MWEGIIRNLAILTLCFYFGHCGTPRADSKNFSSPEPNEVQNANSSVEFNTSEILAYPFVVGKGVIKLNITFINGFNTNYHVSVKSKNDQKCREGASNCDIFYIPKDTLSVIIPSGSGEHVVEGDSCVLKLTCTYEITVESETNNDLLISKIYKIPECVDKSCMCLDKDRLPKPTLSEYKFSNDQIRVNYTTDLSRLNVTNNQNVTMESVDIRFFEMSNCQQEFPSSKLYSTRKPFAADDKLDLPLNKSRDIKCVMVAMNVVASVENSSNCKGHVIWNVLQLNKTAPAVADLISANVNHQQETLSSSKTLLFGVAILVLLSIAICVNAAIVMRGKTRNRNFVRDFPIRSNHHSEIPMVESLIYQSSTIVCKPEIIDRYELSRSDIEFGREIGRGAFGRVYIATMDNFKENHRKQKVAIKKLKSSPSPDEEEEFIGEIETMRKVGKHPNVVRLVGYCKKDNPIMMVMEFVPCGDLLNYLRNLKSKLRSSQCANANFSNKNSQHSSTSSSSSKRHSSKQFHIKYSDLQHSTTSSSDNSYITNPDSREGCDSISSHAQTFPISQQASSDSSFDYELSSDELHNFARQIASGMKHLESLNVTHRDLAARNILIDEQKTLKISDFGMSRDGIYYTTRTKKVPLRWLSIEAMRDNLYSSKSDIWAFAVLLWEIGTLGDHPYPTVGNNEILKYLAMGNRLEKPERCSDFLYELMLHCWVENPDERPDFDGIYDKLNSTKNVVYIDLTTVINPSYINPPTSESDSKNFPEN